MTALDQLRVYDAQLTDLIDGLDDAAPPEWRRWAIDLRSDVRDLDRRLADGGLP